MDQSILIPRYSLRRLLGVSIGCAVVFSIFALARQEYLNGYKQGCWATGISVAIISLVLVFLLHAAVFAVVWLLAELMAFGRRDRPQTTAPTGKRSEDEASGQPTGPQVPSGGSPDASDPILLE